MVSDKRLRFILPDAEPAAAEISRDGSVNILEGQAAQTHTRSAQNQHQQKRYPVSILKNARSQVTSQKPPREPANDARLTQAPSRTSELPPKDRSTVVSTPALAGLYNSVTSLVAVSVTQVVYHVYVKHYFSH